MFDRILLLTDLDDNPELTAGPVAALSEVFSCKVIIFHALRGSSDLFYLQGDADQVRKLLDKKAEDEARPALEKLADELESRGVNTGIVTQVGSAFDLALRAVKDLDIDLVVIPQEGFADFTDRVSGSTTARLIRESAVPVLTINHAFLDRSDKWKGFHRILYPTSLSGGKSRRLSDAEDFAAEIGGTLELVHVIDPIHEQVLETPEGEVILPKDINYRVRSRLEERLSALAHSVTQVPCMWRLLEDTKPGSGVMAYADRSNADLIVVPPLATGDTRHTLLGSVAEHVIKHARVPVMSLKPEKS
ncbi:MAG: universal stress protein [Myxococcales bacterium]|nr:universal stress protein [Myxococcales bacterium]